jgi:hypothetical protein
MRTVLFLSILVVTISCSKQDLSFYTPSNEFISSNVKFQIIDTISFKMSTFKIDSLATDLYNKILVGKYDDPYFGAVKCNGFIHFTPVTYSYDDEAVFDSIVLNLGYSGYYYNDTLLQKRIKVYQLDKRLSYRNGQRNFYNTSNFPASTLIGEKAFYPRISKDSVKITLSPSFGQNLFNKIRDGVINNNEELNQNFKGLKVTPVDNENASIISFDVNNSYLRFYYSDPDEPGEAKYYDYKYTDFTTNRNHFTQISTDRSGTLLPVSFSNQENEIGSTTTNNLTFIQGGEGIVTKIRFPHFKESMYNLNQKGTLYKANLKIPLNNVYFSKKLFTSDSLRVFVVDQNNVIITETKNAHIKKEDPEFNKTYLSLFVEPFLENTLKINSYRNYGLILLPYDYGSATTRLILNDNKNGNEKSKLKITYLTYDN